MKFKKSIIIFLLFVALITIPISYASDLDLSDSELSNGDFNQFSDNNFLINQDLDANILESIDEKDDASLYEVSTFEQDSSNLGSNSNQEFSNLDSSTQNDASNLSSGYENGGPDLDTDFAQIELSYTDENTIFVNASYTGTDELGTQLNPFKTLDNAYYHFSYPKTNIFLAEGTYNLTGSLFITKSINFVGENPLNTIITGLNQSQIFYIPDSPTYESKFVINIINLTLSNGLNHQGGAIYVSHAYLNIINSIFYDNHANDISGTFTGEGGAIYNNASFVKIYNSTFLSNSGYGKYSKYGGAIYNYLGELSVYNSKFINNSLQGNWTSGGAIYNFNGFLTLVNTSIVNTTTNPSYHTLGGAICIWNGRNSYIINSTISENKINGNYIFGSAIANKGVLLEIINSTISNNSANGISVENSTVYNMNGNYDFENSIFENNTIASVRSNLLLCLEDQLIISDIVDVDSLTDLPSSYDLRDYGWVTSVKDQRPGGDCWAFAIYAALESYLLKYENVSYDFSENNMKNAMYSHGINGTEGNSGGNHIMAFAYLLRGSGPVDESLDPFVPSSSYSPEDLPIMKYVTGFKYIPLRLNNLDNDQIKYAILEYGALYTSIYSKIFTGYNGYSNISFINQHAVAIVGWDDNYSASNFANRPPGDGAWIVKNSWGNSSGQGGYYYVSYYDATFPGVTDQFAAIAISSVDNLTDYQQIYQYDMLGNSYESLGYNSNTAWIANQFTSQSDNPLKAFGLYTFGSSSYLVNITVNGISKLVQEGNLTGAGYHTVQLNSLIQLLKGDVFKITVRLTTPESLFPIAIESKRSDYSEKVTAELNQSFISPDGINWYDIAQNTTVSKFYKDLNRIKLVETNVCLKAYTAYLEDLELNLSSNSTSFIDGDVIKFNLTIKNYHDFAQNTAIHIVLDESVDIMDFVCTKGSFDTSNKIWTIDYLDTNQSETLELSLFFNQLKDYVETTVYVNNLSYSVENDLMKSFKFYRSNYTFFADIDYISAIAFTDEKVSISLFNASAQLIKNVDVVLSLLYSSNDYNMSDIVLNTGETGVVDVLLNLPRSAYVFSLRFNGNDYYEGSSSIFYFDVDKLKETKIIYSDMVTTAVVTDLDGRIGEYFKIYLKDKDNVPLANKLVQIGFNGKIYNRTTDSNGLAQLQINLQRSDIYTFAVAFLGDDDYAGFFAVAKITVNQKKMTLAIPDKVYKASAKTKTLTAALKDDRGKLIANKVIKFTVNGKTYSAKTDSKGVAKVNVSLSTKKTYSFTVKFAGDESYGPVTKTAKVIIY